MKANKELNHTASHVLAMSVLKLFPNTKLGFGPPTEEGFYYDFKFENPISDSDLIKIEKQMQKIIANPYLMQKKEANYIYDFSNQEYKKELFDELNKKQQDISFYSIIDPINKKDLFVDLCKGGHIEKIKEIKHFKILSLAGAYWRGDSNNEQLTRIYATAWETKEELENYLFILRERKERDHRKLGKELNYFTFDKLSGQGFPIWLEDGMIVRNKIMNKILSLDDQYGFREVSTPIVGEKELYEISGHWSHYKDDMFSPIDADNEQLVLRPMTCPHHILVYKNKKRSYREFPLRYSEQSPLFRYEKSGALTGLERVRAMLLTEGHVFVRKDQIISEFKHLYKMINETLNFFNIEIDYISLSLRDESNKEKYFDDDEMWNQAEQDLKEVLRELKIEYKEMKGEAAFYGPKIDFQVKTVLGHEITMSTLQLDFLLPRKFDIDFINSQNSSETPIMIHRGLVGTYERFISILLEQTKGVLPFWLSPKQVCIIPINNQNHLEYSDEVFALLKDNKINVTLDDRDERINKKIRESQISKTKIQIIIGDEEVKNRSITMRFYGSEESKNIDLNEMIPYLDSLKNER